MPDYTNDQTSQTVEDIGRVVRGLFDIEVGFLGDHRSISEGTSA